MVELREIYDDLGKSNVRVNMFEIGFAEAATLEVNGQYSIFIDTASLQGIADLKYKLCHEGGHVATGALHYVDSPYDTVARHEYKANRNAFERYLTIENFQNAFASGCFETWELAERFDMPQHYIEKALYYWTQCKGINFNL